MPRYAVRAFLESVGKWTTRLANRLPDVNVGTRSVLRSKLGPQNRRAKHSVFSNQNMPATEVAK